MCSLRTVLWINVSLFSLLALVHGSRILFQWEVYVGSWFVSYWLNGLALLLLGIMIYFNAKHLRRALQKAKKK